MVRHRHSTKLAAPLASSMPLAPVRLNLQDCKILARMHLPATPGSQPEPRRLQQTDRTDVNSCGSRQQKRCSHGMMGTTPARLVSVAVAVPATGGVAVPIIIPIAVVAPPITVPLVVPPRRADASEAIQACRVYCNGESHDGDTCHTYSPSRLQHHNP